MKSIWGRGVVVLLCTSAMAVAETVTVAPSKDNTIYEMCGGGCPEGGSNGQGVRLFAGRTGAFGARRALVFFDVAAQVPPGSIITAAELTLAVSASSSGNPNSVTLHRLTADWGEGASDAGDPGGAGALPEAGDASWVYRFYDGITWSAPGGDGDYELAPSAQRSLDGAGVYAWSSAQLVADVQAWRDDPATNHGWMIKGAETSGGTSRRIGSRENSDPDQRPRLVVEFLPPPAVPASSALGIYIMGAVLLMALTLVAGRN